MQNLSEKIQIKWLQGWIGALLPLATKLKETETQAVESLASKLGIKMCNHRKLNLLSVSVTLILLNTKIMCSYFCLWEINYKYVIIIDLIAICSLAL